MAPRTHELATSISENLSTLQKFLKANNLPDLSIKRDACQKFLALVSGSFMTLAVQTTTEFANTQAVCRFKIASSFPDGQDTATYEELAERCQMPEPEVRCIIRALIPSYVFQEKSSGVVTHTAASKMISVNPLMRKWIDMTASEMHPAILRFTDAMQKWPGSEEPDQTGYSLANDTEDLAFAHMAKLSGRSERFTAAMMLFSKVLGNSPKWLVENYPWGSIGIDTLGDVGGSSGEYSICIARAFPNLKCIVQDLPEVVVKVDASLPSDLKDRVSFMAHDFSTGQPVQGAEVYLFRWILHDWSDKYAIRILQLLVPALKSSPKIVLHENILPIPGDIPTLQDGTLSMRALTNGKEREIRDWKALLASADSRFNIEKIVTLHGSALGIIEVGWKP